jgi:DNA (cytosine-5)-methyltransferase 1
MFNQGVNAQYKPQITQDGVAGSMVARGPADKGDQDTVVCTTEQRTHALTTRAACEEDGTGRGNPIGPSQAVGFNWQNGGGYGKANDGLGITEEGTGPLQRCNTPAVAFTQNQREEVRILDIASACSAEPGSHQQTYIAQPAVAYVKATNPHSKEEAPRYEEAAVSACLNGWDERHDPPKHMVAFAQNQLGEVRCNSEVMGTVNTNQNASGRNTPMVMHECIAFKPGQSEAAGGTFVTEEFAPTMQAQNNGSTAVPAVAFANRTRGGIKVPEVMKYGVVPALTNPGGGGRADAVNVCLPALQVDQSIAFNAYQRTEGDATWPIGASDGRKVEVGVRSGMQVRRLTPSECEYLQGFPAGHTDIVFRKKPAADGPRYRALGNSMAVPCMVWLGHRIHKATKGDNK